MDGRGWTPASPADDLGRRDRVSGAASLADTSSGTAVVAAAAAAAALILDGVTTLVVGVAVS